MDRALLRLYLATFLYSLAQAVGLPLVPEYLDLDFGRGTAFIGLTMGLYGLMQIVLRLPMGDLADRHGRRPSLLVAFGFTFLAGLLFILAPDAWWVVPGVAAFGFGGGIYWVAANSYLFDRAGEGDVARATSDYSLALGLAFLVGPPLGHLVADHWGFRAAFSLYLWTSLLGLLLVLGMPETPPEPRPPARQGPYRRAWKLLRHRALVRSAVGTLLYSMLFSVLSTFFQLHVLALGFSVTVVGLLLAARQGVSLGVRAGLPVLLRRAGAARVLFAGVSVTALSVALVPFATDLGSLTFVGLLAGAATGVLVPANLMLVHEGAPPGQRGLANGIYGTMLGLGSAVSAAAFGLLGARLGLAWAFWGAGLLALALVFALAPTLLSTPSARLGSAP